MSDLIIYGVSDDLVELYGAIRKEFIAPGVDGWTGRLTAPDGSNLLVVAKFWSAWEFTIEDGSTPRPPWPIRTGRRGDYDKSEHRAHTAENPALIIDVPEGTTVRKVVDDDYVYQEARKVAHKGKSPADIKYTIAAVLGYRDYSEAPEDVQTRADAIATRGARDNWR